MPFWNNHLVRYALRGFTFLRNGHNENMKVDGIEKMIFAPRRPPDDPSLDSLCPFRIDLLLTKLIVLCLCNLLLLIVWKLCCQRHRRRELAGQDLSARVGDRITISTARTVGALLQQQVAANSVGDNSARCGIEVQPPANVFLPAKRVSRSKKRRMRENPAPKQMSANVKNGKHALDDGSKTSGYCGWTLVLKRKIRLKKQDTSASTQIEANGAQQQIQEQPCQECFEHGSSEGGVKLKPLDAPLLARESIGDSKLKSPEVASTSGLLTSSELVESVLNLRLGSVDKGPSVTQERGITGSSPLSVLIDNETWFLRMIFVT